MSRFIAPLLLAVFVPLVSADKPKPGAPHGNAPANRGKGGHTVNPNPMGGGKGKARAKDTGTPNPAPAKTTTLLAPFLNPVSVVKVGSKAEFAAINTFIDVRGKERPMHPGVVVQLYMEKVVGSE